MPSVHRGPRAWGLPEGLTAAFRRLLDQRAQRLNKRLQTAIGVVAAVGVSGATVWAWRASELTLAELSWWPLAVALLATAPREPRFEIGRVSTRRTNRLAETLNNQEFKGCGRVFGRQSTATTRIFLSHCPISIGRRQHLRLGDLCWCSARSLLALDNGHRRRISHCY